MTKEEISVLIANQLNFVKREGDVPTYYFTHTTKDNERCFLVISNSELDLEKFISQENIKSKSYIISILITNKSDLYMPKGFSANFPQYVNVIEFLFYTENLIGIGLTDAINQITGFRDYLAKL